MPNNSFPIPEWTTIKSMKSLGYHIISGDDTTEYVKYGNDPGTMNRGYGPMWENKQILYINRGYYTSLGKAAEKFIHSKDEVFVGIREDGDTRTVYNGTIPNVTLFIQILDCIR